MGRGVRFHPGRAQKNIRAIAAGEQGVRRAAADGQRQDAVVNALVLLDMFAKGVLYTIDQALHQFTGLLSAYFPRSPPL